MFTQKHTVPITVDADGDATAYTNVLNGRLINIIYTKTDFANGVDFTITGETTGLSLWAEDSVDAAKTISPRQPAHSQAGVALLYAAAGEAVTNPICMASERVKIVVANGGVSKSGTFDVIVAGPSG